MKAPVQQRMWYGNRKEQDPVIPGFCDDCEKKPNCKSLCKPAQKMVFTPSQTEKRTRDKIIMFPHNSREMNFASTPEVLRQEADFSGEECLKINTDALETNMSNVFAERFFNKRSFNDIADQMNIRPGTAASYFYRACEKIEKLFSILDGREKGLKWLVNKNNLEKFTDDEKAFLLSHVFGFKSKEIADILGGPSQSRWKGKIKALADKYRAFFDEEKTMNIGKLDQAISIYTITIGQNEYGEPVETQTLCAGAPKWAKMEPLRGLTRVTAQTLTAVIETKFIVRRWADLTPAHRLKHGSDWWNIQSIEDHQRKGYQVLWCKRTE